MQKHDELQAAQAGIEGMVWLAAFAFALTALFFLFFVLP